LLATNAEMQRLWSGDVAGEDEAEPVQAV
jgi:hypothetical protein